MMCQSWVRTHPLQPTSLRPQIIHMYFYPKRLLINYMRKIQMGFIIKELAILFVQNSVVFSYIMTSLFTWCSWLVLFVSAANELTAQQSNTRLVLAETLHLPQLHLYRSATGWFHVYYLWGIFNMWYVQQQHVLHAHSGNFYFQF